METTIYNVDYFIAKFSAIPEEKWFIGDYHSNDGKSCALGHCNHHHERPNIEGVKLHELFKELYGFIQVADVNDGKREEYKQPTPKQRILAALYDIKAKQQPEVKPEPKEKVIYKTVTVDSAVRSLQKMESIGSN